MVCIMMNQQFSFPGRGNRCGGGCDRAPFRSRTGRGMTPGQGIGGCGCGNRLPTNRDMDPRMGRSCPYAPGSGMREVEKDALGSPCASKPVETKPCGEMTPSTCGCTSCASGRPSADKTPCGGLTRCDKDGQDTVATCRKLMDRIRAVDFALYETVLYLDVYPHSCEALATYHKLKEQREELHRSYEATVGPLTAFGNQSTTSWDWMRKPFPWEYDAD